MKNILLIDASPDCLHDVFEATEEEFERLFPDGHDVAFVEEASARHGREEIDAALDSLLQRRCPKRQVRGIHGTLYRGMPEKKAYFPTRTDDDAVAPDGRRLR